MSFVRVRPPAVIPVDIRMAAKNLRVDGDYLDDLIEVWVKGITADLEHKTGVCVMRQGQLGSFAQFTPEMQLPHPALAVTAVTYVDGQGDARSLDLSTVKIVRRRYESVLVPKPGCRWPISGGWPDSVRIEVDAGFGDTPADTPECIRLYILAKLADQFDPVTQSDRGARQSAYVDRLLDDCKTYA